MTAMKVWKREEEKKRRVKGAVFSDQLEEWSRQQIEEKYFSILVPAMTANG